MTKRVIDYSSITQCDGDDANLSLSLCSGREEKADQSAHSCGSGVAQEQKCLASSGGKTCFSGVTRYLNIVSVLYRLTHNAVYYTDKTFLYWCWRSCQFCTGRNIWFRLNSKRQRGWNTDCYRVFLNECTSSVIKPHISPHTANKVNVHHHCTTVSNTFIRRKQRYSTHTLLDLVTVFIFEYFTLCFWCYRRSWRVIHRGWPADSLAVWLEKDLTSATWSIR